MGEGLGGDGAEQQLSTQLLETQKQLYSNQNQVVKLETELMKLQKGGGANAAELDVVRRDLEKQKEANKALTEVLSNQPKSSACALL